MSLEKSIESIVSKLDQLSTRLGNIESKLSQGGGSSGGSSSTNAPSSTSSDGVPAKVQEYLDNVFTPNIPEFLNIAKTLGGQTHEAAQKFSQLLGEHQKLLTVAAQSKKPADADFAKILMPSFTLIQELGEFAGTTRGTDHFIFVSSISEGAGALLWPQHGLPAPYIKEMIGASQFHSNKILREFKGKDATKSGFVSSLNGYLKSLEDFVKKVHTTGLVWNPNGGDALSVISSTPSPAPQGGPQGGPPGPPPPAPKLEPSTSSSSDADARSNLLASLNQGEGITGKLKKVTDDMKTKNRKDRTGVVTEKKPVVAKKTPVKKFPPKFELEGSKWVLDYVTEQVTVDITETKQSLSLYKTDGATIRINGKFNGLVIDSCRKTTIVFDEAISSCQLINCNSIKIQVLQSIPSVSIDKTSGCYVYLSEPALGTQVITSKSDECNVLVQKGEDWVEFPVPEQFVSTIVDGKLKTENVAHIGD